MKLESKNKLKDALIRKFGIEVVQDPLEYWNREKEDAYLTQVEKMIVLDDKNKSEETREIAENVYVVSKLFNRKNGLQNCKLCKKRTKNVDDDVCFAKYETCYKCYIEHIEDRNLNK